MIVFDASAIVGAALREDSVPEWALVRAFDQDIIALSPAVDAEIGDVLFRPKFARGISVARALILEIVRGRAAWFNPTVRVGDCRDAKDNKYLELTLAAGASILVTSDADLLVLTPWRCVRILRPADYAG